MNEPWFDPNSMAWIPGTVLGVSLGLWGSIVGTVARQGQGRTAVLTINWVLELISLGLLVGGLVALLSGQPYGVWYGLLLPGLIGVGLTTWLILALPKFYRLAEQRKMRTRDMTP